MDALPRYTDKHTCMLKNQTLIQPDILKFNYEKNDKNVNLFVPTTAVLQCTREAASETYKALPSMLSLPVQYKDIEEEVEEACKP